MPALVTGALLVMVFVCGARAVVADLRARRWFWALAGTVATVTSLGALFLVVSFAHLSAPIGL